MEKTAFEIGVADGIDKVAIGKALIESAFDIKRLPAIQSMRGNAMRDAMAAMTQSKSPLVGGVSYVTGNPSLAGSIVNKVKGMVSR